jgi:hypothetical protein
MQRKGAIRCPKLHPRSFQIENMDINDVIRQICIASKISVSSVIRRGKPSPTGAAVRERAKSIVDGTSSDYVVAPVKAVNTSSNADGVAIAPGSNERSYVGNPPRTGVIGGGRHFLVCKCGGRTYPYRSTRDFITIPKDITHTGEAGEVAPKGTFFQAAVVHFECSTCNDIFIDMPSVQNHKLGSFRLAS